MEELKLGICGWGNVATGLFNALEKNADMIAINAGAQFTVSVIGARRDNPNAIQATHPLREIYLMLLNTILM
jgi:homoserine dehydrogenase